MATTVDYIAFVMDSLALTGLEMEFRYKKMFGEYCVYANQKPVLLVCDNSVFAKMVPCTERFAGVLATAPPYVGGKPHYVVDMEDRELVQQIVLLLEQHTLLPKPRKSKGAGA